MKEFVLDSGSEFIDLCDLMKASDLCGSGGEAKHFIAEGLVKVDGVVETRKRKKIRRGEVVEFQGKKVKVI